MKSHTILLYGASNLWLSRRAALTEIRKRFSGPLEIGLAHGPGRSYGLRAGNPLIRYEPLSEVEFSLGREQRGERLALITDIGNDIAYAQEPERVIAWVSDLSTRLEAQNFRVIVGGVPAQSLAKLNPLLFQTFARLYYPDGSVSKDQVTRDLKDVEMGLRELCAERGYTHTELDSEWYSYDRFHLKRKARTPYWQTLLQSYPVRRHYRTTWSFKVRKPLFPERYWLVGKERTGTSRYLNLVPNSLTLVR